MVLRKLLFATLFTALLGTAAAGDIRPVAGVPFPMPPGFAGYNGRSTEGPSWGSESFRAFIAAQAPGWIRYPGGTVANYWDWRTGTFLEGSGKLSSFPYPISLFTAGLPADTRIVYVVNMVRVGPGTLVAKVEDILAALAEFDRCGPLPEVVELGNEFYFDNEHAGEYAADCRRYLADARHIALSVRAKYPQLKLLLCTTKAGTPGRERWNALVRETLATDAAFRGAIHGVVQHHYISDRYGSQAPVADAESASQAIAEGVRYPLQAISDGSYDAIPEGLPLWITEYGVTKRNAEGTWVAGLRAVAMSLAWLDWHDRLECLLWHHITDTPDVLTRDGCSPGPIGTAYGLLMRTAVGVTDWQKIVFENGPTLSDGTALLLGYKATDGTREKLLVLNIGAEHIETDLSGLMPGNVTFSRQVSTQTPWDATAALHTSSPGDLRRFPLAPFSLTLIETTPQK